MEPKDYLTLGLSLLGLFVSVAALYLGQFRRPRFVVTLGPDVHLYYPADGGSAVYLPMIFSNNSPTRGVIYQIYLRILTPKAQNYYLRWRQEATIDDQTLEYSYLGRVKPLTVDGYSSQAKVYWFIWPSSEQPLLFEEGRYSFTAYVWSKHSAQPDIEVTENLQLDKQGALALADNLKKKDPHTRYAYFVDRGLIATRAQEDDPNKIWANEATKPR